MQQSNNQMPITTEFLNFLNDYRDDNGNFFYYEQAKSLIIEESTTLRVDVHHVAMHGDLIDLIYADFYKYQRNLDSAVQQFVASYFPDQVNEKTYRVAFYNLSNVQEIRELRTENLGKLTAITGTVTRTSEVRPELLFGSFKCKNCDFLVKNVEQQFKYTKPQVCPNGHCGNKFHWELILEESEMCDWQKIRVQEHSSSIPAGSMPRSLDVVVRHEAVDKAKPGERLIFVGSLIVIPDVETLMRPGERQNLVQRLEGGRPATNQAMDAIQLPKSLGIRDLTYKLCFLATTVDKFAALNYRDDDEVTNLSPADQEMIRAMRAEPDLYNRLAHSIAPSIYGHADVKKGIILLLLGGVHKKTAEGMKLRGDINICLVGDPSTAKSQFLKYVCSFLPKAIFTSGRASTVAGLTAAVMRDQETGDVCIEAGALLLADNGICCIDEFDKMEARDQVAIHEAMEQQTISIAKAGIQATLNSRCSILAAANPRYGRYDKSKNLKQNVEIPPPLMSRFDLFFIIVDEKDLMVDMAIAKHLVGLHVSEQVVQPEFSMEQLQKYIMAARQVNPCFNPDSAALLRDKYKKLRQADAYENKSYRITVRQLESLIRLSEAIARLNFDQQVRPDYVEEASKLLGKSIISIDQPDVVVNEADDEQQDRMDRYRHEQVHREIEAEQIARAQMEPQRAVITFDEYQRIAKGVALFIREREDREEYQGGVLQSDVLNWYIEMQMQHIESDEDVNRMVDLLNGVIMRLIRKDNILIIVEDNEEDPTQRKLRVNANYVVD